MTSCSDIVGHVAFFLIIPLLLQIHVDHSAAMAYAVAYVLAEEFPTAFEALSQRHLERLRGRPMTAGSGRQPDVSIAAIPGGIRTVTAAIFSLAAGQDSVAFFTMINRVHSPPTCYTELLYPDMIFLPIALLANKIKTNCPL